MKTKIKRHYRSVLSVVLALCMLVSCMTVGLIATDAAKVTDNVLGAHDSSESIAGGGSKTGDWYLKSDGSGTFDDSGIKKTNMGDDYNWSFALTPGDGILYWRYWSASDSNNLGARSKDADNNGGNDNNHKNGLWGSTNSWKYDLSNMDSNKPTTDFYEVKIHLDPDGGDTSNSYAGWTWVTYTKKSALNPTIKTKKGSTETTSFKVGDTVSLSSTYASGSNFGTVSAAYAYKLSTSNSWTAGSSFTPATAGTYDVRVVLTDTGVVNGTNARRARTATATKQITVSPATTKLTKPQISIANNGTVNSGDSVVITVTNNNTITAQGDSDMTYKLYKGSSEVSSDRYSVNTTTGTITLQNCSAADAATNYNVKAVTSNTSQFSNSESSSDATLTVYSPQFSLLGNVGSADIGEIVNASGSHDSDAPHEWPNPEIDDDKYFKESVRVNNPTDTPGKYSIQFKVKSSEAVHIGIYQSATGQRGFAYNGTNYDTRNNDLAIPSGGIEGIDLIAGASSMVFKPGVVYTLTIDQTQTSSGKFGKISITSDSADVNAIARYKTFNPTTGQLNTGVANAPAAVGTATASPSFGHKPYDSTLTATVSDTSKYQFAGWYSDVNCETKVSDNAEYVAQNVNADVNYYALFTEKTPTPVDLTFNLTDCSVTNVTGTHSGSDTSYTVYPGATVTFTVAPQSNTYELKSVTATNGSVSVSGNNVTISNISADTTVNVLCTEVETYSVTIAANSSSYGKYTVSYTQQNGNTGSVTSTNTTQTITIKKGTNVTLTATANSNGLFDGWKVVNGTYLRSKSTPFTANEVIVQPTSNFSIQALFEAGISPTGTNVTSGYGVFIKTSGNKETDYNTTAKLYRTTNGSNYEYRSYFTIGDTNDPYNGKLKVGQEYWFALFGDESKSHINDSHYDKPLVLDNQTAKTTWYEFYEQGEYSGKRAVRVKFTKTARTAVVYWGKRATSSGQGYFDQDDNNTTFHVNFNVKEASSTIKPTDDTPSLTGMNNLYVLDGIVTRKDNNIQDFGTNTFGDSKIISAKSGVVTYNYFNAQGDEKYVMTDNTRSEGQTQYHYNPKTDLDFRVQTTIAANHQAIGVRAYVMNGITYPAKKDKNGNYYADITLDANSGEGTLEVIPVYYNTLIPEKDYIKFYVDANTIGDTWGKTIGYSIWYKDDSKHGMEGGYPGQPLLSDGNKLYGYFPRYYVGVNDTTLPTEANKNKFAGVLLTNLAEHNYTHQDVLKDWNVTAYNKNYQTFDYEDPVKIADIPNVDTIEFVAKYEESNTDHKTGTHFVTNYSTANDLNGKATSTFPSGITKPASASDLKGFEILTDIDGNPVDIYNNKLEGGAKFGTGEAVYVVSVGNQIVTPNQWDTVWMVYSNASTPAFITAKNPAEFINVAATSQQNNLKGKTVYINYEKFLDGDAKSGISNSGDRIDGRWLYSKSTDPTTIRLRVATEDESGNLTFKNEFLDWAEVSNGEINGAKETGLPEGVFDTKRLNLPNRTTEVTAKINPVGYEVTGMYMLSAKYTSTADNGYSSKISDYDDLNVTGTATSFTNTRDNRMVIIVREIPATNLLITHQMYGGPGAHKIKGFYYVKAELINSDGTVNKTYGVDNDYTNKPLMIEDFTTDAPKNGNYKLKVYIKTAMSGAATFNQWYENDPETVYNALPSDDKRGSSDPVEYVKEIDVAKDLYKTNAENLLVKNLDYYSDLQSADSVNINHTLIQSTVDAGFTGSTYNKVTVVDSSGNTIAGGDLAARARTTTVDTNFITQDNASNGSQLKIEIWTVPTEPAKFDKFYKSNQTEMTTGSTDGIYYHTGETTTIGGVTYEKATVMVPISYFFKDGYDEETGDPIKVFDPAKKDFNLYSSLKAAYKYTIQFKYDSRLYGEQKYVVKGDVTPDLAKFFDKDKTAAPIGIVDENAQELINLMAPLEDNFQATVTWESRKITQANYHDGEFSFRVDASGDNENRTFECYFNLPYKTTLGNDELTVDNKDSAKRPYLATQTDTKFSADYGDRYILDNDGASNKFISAEPVINAGTDENPVLKYFQYWNVYRTGDEYIPKNVIRKCYFNAFNLTFYEAYRIEAVYGDNKPASPSSVSESDGVKASISFLENSRNQWNKSFGGNVGTFETQASGKDKSYWNYRGDRIFSDFALSFSYNDLKLKGSTEDNIKTYLVIERLGVLADKTVDGKKVKDTTITKPADDGRADVQSYISGTKPAGKLYIKEEIAKSELDNKNCIEYYYNFANRKQENNADPTGEILLSDYTVNRNFLYRAYAVITDGTQTVASDPAYFTIYDMASVENYQQKNYSQN